MGNCLFTRLDSNKVEEMIKVVTSNGGIMELYPPITAACITNEFPGQAIFENNRHRSGLSPPLHHHQELNVGQLYYLLPINLTTNNNIISNSSPPFSSLSKLTVSSTTTFCNKRSKKRLSTVLSSAAATITYHVSTIFYNQRPQKKYFSSSTVLSSTTVPYRVSLDKQRRNTTLDDHEAVMLPRCNSRGVWKVRLVITPGQLSEILSMDDRTEELIESVRTVAKCGNGANSVASSDNLSVSSDPRRYH